MKQDAFTLANTRWRCQRRHHSAFRDICLYEGDSECGKRRSQSRSVSQVMMGRELTWTKKQITDALLAGRIAGIAAVNLTIQFAMQNGLDRGVLIQHNGAIKRFNNDSATWRYVDQIKREVGHAS